MDALAINTSERDDEEFDNITSSQIDRDMYHELKSNIGTRDKQSFQKDVFDIWKDKPNELIHVRQSLYNTAIKRRSDTPIGQLVKRTNSGNSKAIVKIIDDIYVLFQFIEGGADISEVKQVLCYKDRMKSFQDEHCQSPLRIELFKEKGNQIDGDPLENCPTTRPKEYTINRETIHDLFIMMANTRTEMIDHMLSIRREQDHMKRDIQEIREQLVGNRSQDNSKITRCEEGIQRINETIDVMAKKSNNITNQISYADALINEARTKSNVYSKNDSHESKPESASNTHETHISKGVTKATVHVDAKQTKTCPSEQLSVTLNSEHEKRVVDYKDTSHADKQQNDESYTLTGVKRNHRRHFGDYKHNNQENSDEDGFTQVTRKERRRSILMSRINGNCSEQTAINTIVTYAKEQGVQLTSVSVLKWWEETEESGPTYTVRAYVKGDEFDYTIEKGFWPPHLLVREWVERPYNRNKNVDNEWNRGYKI